MCPSLLRLKGGRFRGSYCVASANSSARAVEAGVSRDEIMRSEIRHLLMRRRAYEKRKRREEIHLIGIRNEIRSALGSDDLIEDPYGSTEVSQADTKDAAARKELLRRMTFEDTQPMAPEDLSHLTE